MSELCCTRLAENTGRKTSPFWHHCTTLLGCIFAAEACIDNRKKNLLSRNMSFTYRHNMRLRSVGEFGAPLQISMGFACWQRYCTSFQYWVSAKLCGIDQRAPPVFGRAAITLGIGPHFYF